MISFDKTEFQLGNIKYGNIGTAVVNVTNNSTTEVELIPANSSCSCTTGTVKLKKLPPGGQTQFIISLSSTKAGKGLNQVKSISLKYVLNRQQHSQVFRVKANII